jgi:hypothetical protein
MVKYLLRLWLMLPQLLMAADFSATVDHNQISIGESFVLTLTLKDASAKSPPALEPLHKLFTIHSQQQSHSTVVMNGRQSSSISWKLTLMAKGEGVVTIPSLRVDSSAGTLASKPIPIHVTTAPLVGDGSSDTKAHSKAMIVTAEVSSHRPYKNQPLIFTAKLIAKQDITNVRMEKMQVDNAIVELNGEPKAYQKVIDGIRAIVIEFSYLITPLKEGTLIIPAAALQGDLLVRRTNSRDIDLFAMLQGFDQLKPFVATTDKIELEVLPPVASVKPWLPAQSLTIEEISESSTGLQVGEPFSRAFKISATGIRASQLPSLEQQQNNHRDFKAYADKPELSEQVTDSTITSQRIERYTIIPQQSGELSLPELTIAWWDVTAHENRIAHLPARNVHIMPAAATATISQSPSTAAQHQPPSADGELPIAPPSQNADPLLYGLIFALAAIALAAIGWAVALRRKIDRLKPSLPHPHRSGYSPFADPELTAPQPGSLPEKKKKLQKLNPT